MISIEDFHKIIKESKIKECFYFDHGNCSKKVINSHSVQKSKILKKIAVDGMVITYQKFGSINKVGKKVASTFTGFCDYHDKVLFVPIEDRTYNKEPMQNFLFAYRAFALEMHKKLEVNKLLKNISEQINSNSNMTELYESCLQNDGYFVYDLFTNGFKNNDYSELLTKYIELNYEVSFTVATTITLNYSINGKKICDLKDFKKPVNMLFLNIFPEDGKTYMLFSWFKYSDKVYKHWFYELLNLDKEKQFNYLNYLIPKETENFYLSPMLWDSWTEEAKTEFQQCFEFSLLMNKINTNERSKFDLFQNINEN